MTTEEAMLELRKGKRVRVNDWPENDFIFRMPPDLSKLPAWLLKEFEHDQVLELNERSIYDEHLNEVGAVTLVENFDMDWELYEEY
jgi:hypothetical protein